MSMVDAKLDHICNSFTNILLRRVVVRWRKRRAGCRVILHMLERHTSGIRFLILCAAASQFTTYVFIINYNRTCERCELTSFASAPGPGPCPIYSAWRASCFAHASHLVLSFVSLSLENVCALLKRAQFTGYFIKSTEGMSKPMRTVSSSFPIPDAVYCAFWRTTTKMMECKMCCNLYWTSCMHTAEIACTLRLWHILIANFFTECLCFCFVAD